MELEDALRQRRSERHFADTPVARGVIEALLAAAVWAPSAGNRQPWRVEAIAPEVATPLVRDLEPRAWEILYGTLRDVMAADATVAGRASRGRELTEAVVKFVDQEIALRGAPWLLLVHFPRPSWRMRAREVSSSAAMLRHRVAMQQGVGKKAWLASYVARRARVAVRNDHLADVGSVAGFMLALALAATDRGLSSCIQYSWGLVAPEVRRALDIPRHHEILGAVAVGWPDPQRATELQGRVAARKPLAVRWHGAAASASFRPPGSGGPGAD